MKTKTIFKTLALAMMMPAMLLTTACSSSNDDAIINNENINNENTAKKGFTIPVTVNVTRQGDATTRATYDDSGKKLSFEAGDKLFVIGSYIGTKQYAGTLDYVSEGTFTGTIYSEVEYSGTADDFLKNAEFKEAILLPKDNEEYKYLTITGTGYSANVAIDATKAFAATKTAAVEQFSMESAISYSSGFALTPKNAILNFTITNLTANAAVNVALGGALSISKQVTTDGSGNATFAVGVAGGTDFNALSLTVGGNAITLASSSKTLEAGKIYNITRSAAPAARALSEATTDDIGKIAGADGNIYDTKAAATTAGTTAVAMIAYVGSASGLAIALENVGSGKTWDSAAGLCNAWNESKKVTGGTWRLPTVIDWQNMFIGCGTEGTVNNNPTSGYSMSYSGLASKLGTAGVDAAALPSSLWSTDGGDTNYWYINFENSLTATFRTAHYSDGSNTVRACLAFGAAAAGPKAAADATTEDIGKVIGADGKIYDNATAATAASTTAVAMIAYVGSATGETSYTHGLALALKDANNGSTCLWSTSTSSTVHAYYTTNSSDFSSTSESGLQYNNSSYNPNHNTDEYPAFKAAMAYNSSTAPTNCSAWFLPTCYQLQLMIDACKNVLGTNGNFTDLRDAFNRVGGENMKSSTYWLATEYEAYYAWRYLFDNGTWSGGTKNFDFCVRSAIAF